MICNIGQPFAKNYNPSYAGWGLKGHTGVDASCGYGTPIYSKYDGLVYKVLTKENPANDGSGFTGVFMIVDDGIECFEWLVGHCDPTVREGQQIKKGDLIGYEANHGTVYSGNMLITLEMQATGVTLGAHRHYQKRPLILRRFKEERKQYLTRKGNASLRDARGYFYEIPYFNNGYNGCVDPEAPLFSRNLWFGSEGYDVFVLQRFLRKLNLFSYPECTGYFGMHTGTALKEYQRIHDITPTLGYLGPKTRSSILNREIFPEAPILTDE